MSKIFDAVNIDTQPSSTFDLSHMVGGTGKMGTMIPVMCEEVLPGDIWKQNSSVFLRTMPLIAPIQHQVNVFLHSYYVPKRLVFNQWNDHIRGGDDGVTDYPIPYFEMDDVGSNDWFNKGTLADYMGLPVCNGVTAVGTSPEKIDATPFRAYALIWNEFFRDENLQEKINFSLAGGKITQEEAEAILTIRTRAWEKDLFTSCLPFAQKGEEVSIPVTGVIDDLTLAGDTGDGTGANIYRKAGTTNPTGVGAASFNNNGGLETSLGESTYHNHNVEVEGENIPVEGLQIDISDFRKAAQLQKFYELLARAGNRIQEFYWSMYGVKTSDQRLQLPEFLGGSMTPVLISDVMQTSSTDATSPQGNPAGKATAYSQNAFFQRRFEEHGWVITIMTIMPRTGYSQGIPKKFQRLTQMDNYFPLFANLGEEPIKLKEVCYTGNEVTDNEVFGFQAKDNHLRYIPSRYCGEMRGSLSFWNMGRLFNPANPPQLNDEFIQCNPRKDGFAVTDDSEDELIFQIRHNIRARRKMPYIAKPGIHII